MSEQKRYTAEELKVLLNASWHYLDREMVYDIIRQAADAEEELENRKHAYAELMKVNAATNKENAQLKARLEAVVKECEMYEKAMSVYPACHVEGLNVTSSILRAARGESKNENK